MRLSEKVDNLLRQYNYRRKRGTTNNRTSKNFELEEYFGEVDSYIETIIEGIDNFLPKNKGF